MEDAQGNKTREYPRLQYGGTHLTTPHHHVSDITGRLSAATASGLLVWLAIAALMLMLVAWRSGEAVSTVARTMWQGRRELPWRSIFITLLFITLSASFLFHTVGSYHVLGTDKVGEDVLYQAHQKYPHRLGDWHPHDINHAAIRGAAWHHGRLFQGLDRLMLSNISTPH